MYNYLVVTNRFLKLGKHLGNLVDCQLALKYCLLTSLCKWNKTCDVTYKWSTTAVYSLYPDGPVSTRDIS